MQANSEPEVYEYKINHINIEIDTHDSAVYRNWNLPTFLTINDQSMSSSLLRSLTPL